MTELHKSLAYWRRECNLSIERSRSRRAQESPNPWPHTLREWICLLLIAVAIMLGCYGLLVLFGIEAWS